MTGKELTITKIQKRDGRVVPFDAAKITTAIGKSAAATGEFGQKEAERLKDIVVAILTKTNGKSTPTVEQVQDIVEQVLMAASHYKTAKAYILYRKERAQLRAARRVIGVEDDLGMSVNALKAMARRYLLKDERGNVVETPRQAVERVARAVAAVEKSQRKGWEEKFSAMLASFSFVPAGCYFRGAGRKRGLLANCFVLPVEDDMGGIFDAVKWTALIHQAGGGTGYNFSHLRPKGDAVAGGGFASGPVSFMKAFDAATEIVMLGGRHRGANMGILNADHPDIFEFITCKTQEGEIANFNVSVGATDEFMKAVEKDGEWKLTNPRNGAVVQTVGARTIFDQAVALAWKTGDPGMIYLDAVNRYNPLLSALGPIEATNVCGEQPLHPFDVCNLGSVNLGKFVVGGRDPSTAERDTSFRRARAFGSEAQARRDDKAGLVSVPALSKIEKHRERLIDWKRLEEVVRLAVRFLDDGIDASEYPIPQIDQMAHRVRRIGLGVMGWADLLIGLRLRYDSEEAVALAEKVMRFIQLVGWEESSRLAKEKGVFPLWEKSAFAKAHSVLGGGKKAVRVRNVAVTTIAPTGTISMVADCTSGIEPLFALAYMKNVVDQEGLSYMNTFFEQSLHEAFPEDGERVSTVLHEVSQTGSVAHSASVPGWIREVFRTAHEIAPEWHVRMQAAFQRFTDNAVSKTINFPESATIEDVEKAYMLSWKTGCKGITIYRDKSKNVQILSVPSPKKGQQVRIQSKLAVAPLVTRVNGAEVSQQSAGETCPDCGERLTFEEGCTLCHTCGYSRCEV